MRLRVKKSLVDSAPGGNPMEKISLKNYKLLPNSLIIRYFNLDKNIIVV